LNTAPCGRGSVSGGEYCASMLSRDLRERLLYRSAALFAKLSTQDGKMPSSNVPNAEP